MGLVGFNQMFETKKYVSQFFVSSPQISGESKILNIITIIFETTCVVYVVYVN